MTKQIFNQPSLSIEEQLNLLKQRYLIIDDLSASIHALNTIGYCRLKAYFQPFLLNKGDSSCGFKSGVSFSTILSLYNFDRELRILMVDAIERIEVTLRCALSNAMSHSFNPHWYLDNRFFRSDKFHEFFIKEVSEHTRRSTEDFIKRYHSVYHTPNMPPSWMIMECLSFGTISKVYANIKSRKVRKDVGDVFGQYSETLKSWLKALTYTRNICAHHGRLWNRFFINKPKEALADCIPEYNASPIALQVYIVIMLLVEISPMSLWKDKLFHLFDCYEQVVLFAEMGFHEDWREASIWKI